MNTQHHNKSEIINPLKKPTPAFVRKSKSFPKLKASLSSPNNNKPLPDTPHNTTIANNNTDTLQQQQAPQFTTRRKLPTPPQSIPLSTAINYKSVVVNAAPAKPKKKKKNSWLKKISSEWNLLLLKLKAISEDVLSSEDIVDEFFIESDQDIDNFNRLVKNYKGYNSTEERFLKDYKKFKNLDDMAAAYTSNNDAKSSSTMVSDKLQSTIQDIIRKQQQLQQLQVQAQQPQLQQPSALLQQLSQQETRFGSIDSRTEEPTREEGYEDDDEEDEFTSEEEYNGISYHDLDFCQLRKEFENYNSNNASSCTDTESKETLFSESNIGSTLWEYRRLKWLTPNSNKTDKLSQRIAETSIAHVPQDCYVKLYSQLIEHSKVLKPGKRINLNDVMKIINAGWIAEEKWDRAAKGLP